VSPAFIRSMQTFMKYLLDSTSQISTTFSSASATQTATQSYSWIVPPADGSNNLVIVKWNDPDILYNPPGAWNTVNGTSTTVAISGEDCETIDDLILTESNTERTSNSHSKVCGHFSSSSNSELSVHVQVPQSRLSQYYYHHPTVVPTLSRSTIQNLKNSV
jgi:hypothetical protein